MKQAANLKVVPITPPAAIVDDAAFTTAAVDTKGFRHLTIVAIFGALDIAPASASIRHSDASNMGSPATLATGGTDLHSRPQRTAIIFVMCSMWICSAKRDISILRSLAGTGLSAHI